jgi:mRNA interferase MazF
VTCDAWEIAVVPFPFSDSPQTKRRPALVLSRKAFNAQGHTVLAMITSARHSRWPSDVAIRWAAAGLPRECVVRMKVFTIDNRLLGDKAGKLTRPDAAKVRRSLAAIFD